MLERFIRRGSGPWAVRLRALLVLLALPLVTLAAFFFGVANYIKDFAKDFWNFVYVEIPYVYRRIFYFLKTGNHV